MANPYKSQFISAAEDWVCNSSSLDIRYVAIKVGEKTNLLAASIGVSPVPPKLDMSFSLATEGVFAGQIQESGKSKKEILELLMKAAQGKIDANGLTFELLEDGELGYHSELIWGDKWFSELELQVIGGRNNSFAYSHVDSSKIDDALRQATPPFDGLADLVGWLGLKTPVQTSSAPSINLAVMPPVDYDFRACKLEKDLLSLKLLSHPEFDLGKLNFAVRTVPGDGIQSRRQIASDFKWKLSRKGVREGKTKIRLKNADSALTMLVIGNTTVRRQWFIDQAKSGNNRLVTVQLFDKELRMVRNALFESSDATRFEMGVASLFFLMGFSSVVQLESDSPDVVVATPSGRLVLVECTTRIADFSLKLGKLVDRKRMLIKQLSDSQSPSTVDGVLVCGVPRDQIAIREEELQKHQIALISKDELYSSLDRVRFHIDPDKYIDDAIALTSIRKFS
ncbi:MAG: hypothetical protein KJ850_07220 [Gammaproteobacteria bacterium]|nr:hypothetical protein [Gammaproteobacteria bacterium]MBU1982668.1 hypothetical protein [Gammaproteobacteria bacterium]